MELRRIKDLDDILVFTMTSAPTHL